MQTRTLPLLAAFLFAAADASAARYRFRHFGPDDGLNPAVSHLAQDRAGFLWVATGNGLFRYGGARFQRFGVEQGLPSAAVRCLKEGPDGTLWAVTGRGLARFRKNAFQVVETGAAAQDLHATDIGADAYRFHVAARQANGPWSPVPAAVSFRIVPPGWDTGWVLSLPAGACVLLIGLAVRSRRKRARHERKWLDNAVRERIGDIQCQQAVVERQIQEIEERLQEAQEVPPLKSEFRAIPSHQIRTPLNGVIDLIQLVLHTALDDEPTEGLFAGRDSAGSRLVLIDDILDFSRIEAGNMELSREPFCLHEYVAATLAVIECKAQEKSLRLNCDIAPEVPRMLAGDAGRLRQILLNLLGNAMKFTKQGEVSLSVGLDQGPGITLHFVVRDTGIGMAHETQERIFPSLAPADGSHGRQGGAGLGLAICCKLVELMRGRIWVESAPGAGSAFHFTAGFDAAEGQSLPSPANRLAEPAASPSAAPLVDRDYAVNQKLAQWAMQKTAPPSCR